MLKTQWWKGGPVFQNADGILHNQPYSPEECEEIDHCLSDAVPAFMGQELLDKSSKNKKNE